MNLFRDPGTNFEIHLFRGDPGKGQQRWMFSLRTSEGSYIRGASGAEMLSETVLLAVAETLQLDPESMRFITLTERVKHLEALLERNEICTHGAVSGCCVECSAAGKFCPP